MTLTGLRVDYLSFSFSFIDDLTLRVIIWLRHDFSLRSVNRIAYYASQGKS